MSSTTSSSSSLSLDIFFFVCFNLLHRLKHKHTSSVEKCMMYVRIPLFRVVTTSVTTLECEIYLLDRSTTVYNSTTMNKFWLFVILFSAQFPRNAAKRKLSQFIVIGMNKTRLTGEWQAVALRTHLNKYIFGFIFIVISKFAPLSSCHRVLWDNCLFTILSMEKQNP